MESQMSTGDSSEPLRVLSLAQEGDGNKLRGNNQSKPFHVLPSIANHHFSGRDNTLDLLQQKLFIQKESPKMALYGLGGVGKTQVALQLAYWVKKHLPEYSIFWVPVLSEASFEQAYTEIERKLAIPKISGYETVLERVRRYLSSGAAGKWLFVVDNADDMDMLFGNVDAPGGLYKYFPASDNCTTFLTTRSRELAVEFAGMDIIELQKMKPEEATGLFTKIVKGYLLRDQKATAQLLEDLDWLPLAITQAAAYINKTDISTSRYLELMHGTEKDTLNLVSRDFYDTTRHPELQEAIALTWLISFNQIRDSNPSAAKILEFMSFIERNAIPRSILLPFGPEEEVAFAISMLCSYAFLTQRDDADIFDMHDLVQLLTRLWLQKEGDTLQAIQCATRHMQIAFPSGEYKNREVWRPYLPHALRILRHDETQDMVQRYLLFYDIARCLLEDGRTREALSYLEEYSRWIKSYFDDEKDPVLLSSQHELARAYLQDGQTKQGMELLKDLVEVKEKILDEEHPTRIASQHELAGAYLKDDQIKRAVELFKHVVTVKEKTLAKEHADLLWFKYELAEAYFYDGQIKQASELLKHVVAVEEKTLNEEHPNRLASEHLLARAYLKDDQIKRAVELFKHVVAVYERTLHEEHPDRLITENLLARAYLDDNGGQIKQAVELLEHVDAVQEKTLDEEHPDRLASQHTLAEAYLDDGQIKQAVELLTHVVAVQERTLDEEQYARLASEYLLARAYLSTGNRQMAVELLKHVVAVYEKTFDEEHPNRLASEHLLARAYLKDGQIEQAVELLEHVVAVRERTLDEGHLTRLESLHELARAYLYGGQIKQAVELLQHVVAVEEETLGEEDRSRLASQHELAMAYLGDGQIPQAIELLKYVIAVQQRTFEEGHPDRLALASQRLLARISTYEESCGEE